MQHSFQWNSKCQYQAHIFKFTVISAIAFKGLACLHVKLMKSLSLVGPWLSTSLIVVRYGFLGKKVICLKFVKESQSFYYVSISARSYMYTHCTPNLYLFAKSMYSGSIPCKRTVHNKNRCDAWMGLCRNLVWSVPACSCQLISGTDETSFYIYSKKDPKNIYAEKNEGFVKALPSRQP